MTARSSGWFLLMLATVFTSMAHAQPRGPLYLVGGGPQPDHLVREFVELAGGPGRARIVVFAMASASGRESGDEKARDLVALGAEARSLYLTRAEADADSVVRAIDAATGIWFGGGDQSRLTGVLAGTRALAAIQARHRAGAVVGGTSAGAAVASAAMITGDERRLGGSRPPADSTAAFITIDRANVVTADGFGFLGEAIVDQHFVRRRRHNRLLSLVLEGPVRLGVGIDESTALVVEPDGRWRVAGESVVVIYDARRARLGPSGAALGGTGIVTHVLPAGSRFDPAAGTATMP